MPPFISQRETEQPLSGLNGLTSFSPDNGQKLGEKQHEYCT
jgi:hypothetical protein